MNLPTVDDSQTPSTNLSEQLSGLRDRLSSDSKKQQLEALTELESLGKAAVEVLMDFLQERQTNPVTIADGKAYQILTQMNLAPIQDFLAKTFAEGLVSVPSERNIDYQPLQNLLAHRKFEEGDRLTLQKMCELAGSAAINRKWLYFSEVNKFPSTDLQTIDRLWYIYSEGKFGFSVQRELWVTAGKDWERFWPKIGWRTGNTWTRYPSEFIWDISAPKGHLPLSNQLRGVRVIEALMNHPAWQD